MLSKSKVIRGLQCPKSLWLYKHQYNLQDEVSTSQQAIFDTGHSVGELAQQLWPGGVDASADQEYPNILSAKQTHRLITEGHTVIYEATFVHNDTLVAVDILALEDGQWNAYEVKSSTSVKDVNYDDAAVQFYVMKGAGLDVQNISIVHLNNEYIRQGDLDIFELFTIENITEAVLEIQQDMPAVIDGLHDLLKGDMPEKNIGPHCSDPYACSFMGHCWQHIPDYSVFNIARISDKAWELYEQGILEVKDVADDYPLSANQRLQVEIEKSKEVLLDPEGLTDFASQLNYPLYYLDYETINPAIPLFDGLKPYQQMPFQYSLHVQAEVGDDTTHFEYLAPTDGTDPREEFIKKLIDDCGDEGDILVYSIGFERGRTSELAAMYPAYERDLLAICERMVDLMIPFQNKMYYSADMRGRYSIKTVLPALVPELSYDDLEIGDGGTASALFQSYFVSQQELPEASREDLLEYCKLDTLAMVKILEKIYTIKIKA